MMCDQIVIKNKTGITAIENACGSLGRILLYFAHNGRICARSWKIDGKRRS